MLCRFHPLTDKVGVLVHNVYDCLLYTSRGKASSMDEQVALMEKSYELAEMCIRDSYDGAPV